jgi:hypothetical protein
MKYDPLFDSDENKVLMAICTRKLIRNIGIGGIIWGLLNIAFGAAVFSMNIINVGLLVLGVMMLGTGVQALRRPSLGVLLTETVVTVFLLLWNIAIAVLNAELEEGGTFDPQGIVVPLIITFVFANNYRKLGHLRDLISTIPKEKIDATRNICKSILKKKLKEEPTVVQSSDRRCRVQLMADKGFFIQRDMMRAFVGTKDEVQGAVVKPEAKNWLLVFTHPLGKLKYRFDRKNTDKLKAWAAAPYAEDTFE